MAMKYFEVMGEIEKVFPSTVEFDYRAMTPEELWEKIYKLFEKVGILNKLDDKTINHIQGRVIFNQEWVNKSTSALIMRQNQESPTYDQNNYFMKRKVLETKNLISTLILGECNFELVEENYGYTENMGTDEELEKLADHDSIKKYIMDLFTLSAEEGDRIRINELWSVISFDIEKHFGIASDRLSNFIYDEFDSIMRRSSVFLGTRHDYGFDYSEQLPDRYKELLEESTEKIVKKIELLIKNAIDNKKKRDKESKEYNIEQEEIEEEVIEPPKVEAVQKRETSTITEDNYRAALAKYERIQSIMDEQKEILKQLQELEKQKQELLEKLDMNDRAIKNGGGPNAI